VAAADARHGGAVVEPYSDGMLCAEDDGRGRRGDVILSKHRISGLAACSSGR